MRAKYSYAAAWKKFDTKIEIFSSHRFKSLNYFTDFHTIHNITEKNNIFEWCYVSHNLSDPSLDKLKNHVVHTMLHHEKKFPCQILFIF